MKHPAETERINKEHQDWARNCLAPSLARMPESPGHLLDRFHSGPGQRLYTPEDVAGSTSTTKSISPDSRPTRAVFTRLDIGALWTMRQFCGIWLGLRY
jgi:hypothetical protein